MAKGCDSSVLDGLSVIVKTNANKMYLLSQAPTSRADCDTYELAKVTMASGDFTQAADGGGRKLTVAAKSGVTVDSSGTATYVAWVSDTVLLYWDTCTSQVVTAGNTVNFPAVDICKVGQPT
jgi:hypothetical protein